MKRTLLFGGTFDPPHVAHTQVPHAAMISLCFDSVLYIPASQAPLKEEPLSSSVHRLAMLELALGDYPWAEISTIELDRGGTSYTIDTIESLLNQGEELRILIGADQWTQFEQWHRWEDIMAMANPVIMPRKGCDNSHERVLPIKPLPAASTDIRQRLREGTSIDSLVCPMVLSYIAQHSLYL